jgi:hypothetical protein
VLVFALDIFEDVLNSLFHGASLEATFIFFEDGFESIFYHMFSAILTHFFGYSGPFSAYFLGKFEKSEVLFNGPLFFAERGVEMVEPFLSALMGGLKELVIGATVE